MFVRARYVCVAHFFCCTRVFKQDNLHSTGNRVDRQMDYWLLLMLVVAVVVMGPPTKGYQVGGAVSLRISQDQNSHRHLYFYNR